MHSLGSFETFNDTYGRLVREATHAGRPFSPRGLPCRELRPATFSVDPARALYQGTSRRLNYYFFAVETLQYLAGWGSNPRHAKLLMQANSRTREFLNEETGVFDGAYGPRLERSLVAIEELLRGDPSSRQAVAALWEPGLPRPSKDVPCTVALHFFADAVPHYRPAAPIAPALSCCAYMRSNDLNWGTPYDVAAFSAIQCALAGALGWRLGTYHHVAGSLHVYEDYPPNVIDSPSESWIPVRIPINHDALSMVEVRDGASSLLTELCDHLDAGRDRREFTCRSSLRYWNSWVELICFTWANYDARS